MEQQIQTLPVTAGWTAPGSAALPPGLEDRTLRDVRNRRTRILQQAASLTRLRGEGEGVSLESFVIWDE